MKNYAAEGLILVGMTMVAYFIGLVVGMGIVSDKIEQRAIQTEIAFYHPQTKELTWSDNLAKFLVTGEKE